MAAPVKASWTAALFRGLAAEKPGLTSRKLGLMTCPGVSSASCPLGASPWRLSDA